MKKHSIKYKISTLVLACVLLVAIAIGFVSIQSSKRVISQNAQQFLELQNSNKSEILNSLLARIEQSVNTLSEYAVMQLTDTKSFQNNPKYVEEYTKLIEQVAANAADNTEGAMAVYVRYNPEFTKPTSGIFYTRESLEADFKGIEPTDFSMYDPSDVEHVGWYYIPVNNGKPTWMSPYLNQNLGVEMISYVVPITIDGVSIGIIGMDIDFGVVKSIIDDTKLYQSGYAYLADMEGKTIYKPQSALESNEKWQSISSTTSNEMQMVLTAPKKEINEEGTLLMWRILLMAAVGALIAIFVPQFIINGMVRPIGKLNDAANRIAEGNLDVPIEITSKDEIGELAKSFGKTTEQLKTYTACIQETADVLESYAKGDLTAELKQAYTGEFVRIKEGLMDISAFLNDYIYKMRQSSETITGGAKQVADGAQNLSEGAAEQSAAVEDLQNSMKIMTERAKLNAEGANNVFELAQHAVEDLNKSGKQMIELVDAMTKIRAGGENIIKMTEAIHGVAMQTNILALNASIEAARAGEAGKGFSIVAEEVKDLAAKSTEISDQISALMQNAMQAIEVGEQLAGVSEKDVLETAEGAKMIVGIAETIAKGSKEQEEIAATVQKNVIQISDVVAQTASTSEEEAASSEELSAQAVMLNQMIEHFNLKK